LERYANFEDRQRLLELIREKGAAKGFEVRMKRKDNSIFWASLNAITQVAGSGEKQLLSIIEDDTDRKQTEEEIRRNYDIQNVLNSLLRLSRRRLTGRNTKENARTHPFYPLACFGIEGRDIPC